jgi:vacuolar-type H+-ATPase subunit I/STV1
MDTTPNSDIKKSKTSVIIGAALILLVAGCALLTFMLINENAKNEQLQELAELDKMEMELQYEEFDQQYNELQQQLTNDSLIAQIENERRRTQQLLEELRNTKASDAAEITRLKKEIASLRKVLRHYVEQIDSLNRLNEALVSENTQIKKKYDKAATQIDELSIERNELLDKVDLAAQLDATGFSITPKNKRGKLAKKIKDVKSFEFGFTIVKNVTAQNGQRIVYARILKPDGNVMGVNGTFEYENTTLEYTEKKYIEYTGEEQSVVMYAQVGEFLEAGTYRLSIFVDKQMIGETTYTIEK